MANRDARRELGKPAVMIAVPVRDDHVIDLRDARIFRGLDDASCVARCTHAAVARVDEQRLARGRYEERRVAPFDVDDIDLERLRRALRRHDGGAYDNRQEARESAHLVLT